MAVAAAVAVAAVAAVAMSVTNMPIAHYHLEHISNKIVFCVDMHRFQYDIFNDVL